MKKTNVIIATLFLIFILSMCSCGTRKVSIDKSKEETKSETVENSVIEKQVDTNVKTTTETKTDDKNETVTQETIYEPSDNTKESFVIEKDGTKVILNNAKKIVRNTSQKNNTQYQTNQYVDSVKKENAKELKSIKQKYSSEKETKSKDIEKKAVNIMQWISIIVFILCFLIFIYVLIKQFKIIP